MEREMMDNKFFNMFRILSVFSI